MVAEGNNYLKIIIKRITNHYNTNSWNNITQPQAGLFVRFISLYISGGTEVKKL